MGVLIGSARSSYGHTEAGDQSGGREVSTQAWYKHEKGWRVFRAKEASKRSRLAYAMRAACENDRIGYSQAARGTLLSAVADRGYDPALCTRYCCTDCSALVRVCICYAWGSRVIGSFTTAGEPDALLRSGLFTELTGKAYTDSPDRLLPGDILCTRSKGHTVIVLTRGDTAEGDVTIAQGTWNVRSGPARTYDAVGSVHGGDVLEVDRVDEGSGWLHLAIGGWISPKAVKRDE